MTTPPIAIALRPYRKNSGLSLRELANVLEIVTDIQVSRHERAIDLPPFLVAIGYEVIFQASLADLFPGAYETVRQNVEERLEKMESELQHSTAKGRQAAVIARKLEWLWERRNSKTA